LFLYNSEGVIFLDLWLEVRRIKRSLDSAETKKIAAERDVALAKLRLAKLKRIKRINKYSRKSHNIDHRRSQFKARNNDEIQQAINSYARMVRHLIRAIKKLDQKKKELTDIIVRVSKIPDAYKDDTIIVVMKPCCNLVELYYSNEPNVFTDPFHGHYIIDLNGYMKYRREFGEERGPEHHINEYLEIDYFILFPINVYGQCLAV